MGMYDLVHYAIAVLLLRLIQPQDAPTQLHPALPQGAFHWKAQLDCAVVGIHTPPPNQKSSIRG